LVCGAGSIAADEPKAAFFEARIRPVLVDHCYECHSAKSKPAKGGLRLDTKAGLARGGDSGPSVIAGKPEDSPLYLAVAYQGEAENMPPKGKLPEGAIADLKLWIEEGAFDPRTDSAGEEPANAERGWARTFRERLDWWAFRPMNDIRPPGVDGATTPIDAFVLDKLRKNGLEFADQADRPTLLRRLHFDLLGLPPTAEQIAVFLSDRSPDAYENLVDRLLASPHFGERMARRWMDLMRYSETVGSEQDALIPYAWAYRDYLIRAFNADLPYDRLIREHLAGDLIEPVRRDPATGLAESPIGTAWTRFVEYYHSPVDVKLEEAVVIDNQVDTLGKAFLGLTIACARCHDHKFDPIGTDDFYRFYGTLRTARATIHPLADPAKVKPYAERARERRESLHKAVASSWTAESEAIGRSLQAAFERSESVDPRLAEFLKKSIASPQKWAYPFARAQAAIAARGDWKTEWNEAWKAVETQGRATWSVPNARQTMVADFTRPDAIPEGWTLRAFFTPKHTPAGTFRIGAKPESLIEAVRPSGFYSDAISEKLGATLRSPEFTLTDGVYSALVSGTANGRLRLVVDNFQGVDILFGGVTPVLNEPRPAWVRLAVRDIWKGRQAYLELVTRDDMPSAGVVRDLNQIPRDGRSSVGVRYVVHHPNDESAHEESPALRYLNANRKALASVDTPQEPGMLLSDSVREALSALASGTTDDAQAALMQDLIDAKLLKNTAAERPDLAAAVASFRSAEESIDLSARSVGVAEDARSGLVQQVFVRGDHRRLGPVAPLGDLALSSSGNTGFAGDRPARLELADALTRPDHPLTARVMVNRLWSWCFGKGLFTTEDNVGRLGEPPSHPELLDYLSNEFRREGLSTKRMLRSIVLSRAYRQSSLASETAATVDPANRLLSHASVRRLDGESLRDAILTASGRLDRTMFGLPVATPQPPGLTDDKKPVAGPIDGAGRRSIYLNVRKNFPVEFLEVFDRPRPTLPVGRRNVSNQPAQSLAMLNDPFVISEAARLGQWLSTNVASEADRIKTLYLRAFGREPSPAEAERVMTFVRSGAGWNELTHAVFTMKEFLYVK
jgi:hypothetical protein